MAITTLKRYGKNNYAGILTVIGCPNWQEETKMLRFVEENGCSTVFTISKDALPSFSEMELWKTYVIEVPGSCVKTCSSQNKTGVRNTLEVRVIFPLKWQLAPKSFSINAQYEFASWEDLTQQPTNTFVDVAGRVLSSPIIDMNSSLPKMTVQLGFKDMRENVVMLGQHMSESVKKGLK